MSGNKGVMGQFLKSLLPKSDDLAAVPSVAHVAAVESDSRMPAEVEPSSIEPLASGSDAGIGQELPVAVGPVAAPSQLQCYADSLVAIRKPAGLLISGWIADGSGDATDAALKSEGRLVASSAWVFRYPRPDVATYLDAANDAPNAYGFACFLPATDVPDDADAALHLRCGEAEFSIQVAIGSGNRDAYAIGALQGVWYAASEQLLTHFGSLPAEIMTAVVGPMPTSLRLHVDNCIPAGDHSVVINGWCAALNKAPLEVYFVDELTLEATRVDQTWERTLRADVAEALKDQGPINRHCGFVCVAPVGSAESLGNLALYFVSGSSIGRWPLLPPAPLKPRPNTELLLGMFGKTQMHMDSMMRQLGPAIETALPLRPIARDVQGDLRWFGTAPKNPKATIIIPVWRKADLLRYQLAALSTISAEKRPEIIIAIDDPALEESIVGSGDDWLARFGMPFAIYSCGYNLGFVEQLKSAASVARGDVLVLMHSDVLPDQADWLEQLLAVFDRQPRCGVVGPKLLYEDGSIHSEGLLRVRVAPWPQMVDLERVNNGHPNAARPTALRRVDAVPSACLLVKRRLFEVLGGFDNRYLLEDEFAVADFCARAEQIGYVTLLQPSVAMRHLEGHSWDAYVAEEPFLADINWRHKVHLYNCWRHAQRLAQAGGRAA
ncbi:Glycosyltransferase, GT2 family [Hydrocarboniphaga daqingensis]|uniref:Glycosyltransferase, GT2 family n=1 Tax=Hydrocarboniphaga daqingensis TaxID=490188 RepID=A0A1M5N8V6_9GAMM|nr:glycosyltransferase [Hydrocarboniphaga daqingensis]SHG85619.1 Glycosyltransferase, GT2 family [Hydrocarboniphaga daqingensis]